MRLKLNDTEEKMKEECEALSQEWQVERKVGIFYSLGEKKKLNQEISTDNMYRF